MVYVIRSWTGLSEAADAILKEAVEGELRDDRLEAGEGEREQLRDLEGGEAGRVDGEGTHDEALEQMPVDIGQRLRKRRSDLSPSRVITTGQGSRAVDGLAHRLDQASAEVGAVGVVGGLSGEPAADPIGHAGEDLHAAHPELHQGRFLGGHEEGDPGFVALVAGGRPVPLPGDRGAAAALPDGMVGHHRHVLAAAVAAPQDLGDLLVDVPADQRGQGEGAVVHGRQVLDLADRACIHGERPDDARVAPAEGVVAHPRDVLAAPPGPTAIAGAVLVDAHPLGVVSAVALGTGRPSLGVLLLQRLRRPGSLAEPGQPEGKTLRGGRFRSRRRAGRRRQLGGVELEQRSRELLAGREPLLRLFRHRLADQRHHGSRDGR